MESFSLYPAKSVAWNLNFPSKDCLHEIGALNVEGGSISQIYLNGPADHGRRYDEAIKTKDFQYQCFVFTTNHFVSPIVSGTTPVAY